MIAWGLTTHSLYQVFVFVTGQVLLVTTKICQWLTNFQSLQVTFHMMLLLQYGICVSSMLPPPLPSAASSSSLCLWYIYIIQYDAGSVVYGRHVLQVMKQPTKFFGKLGEGQDIICLFLKIKALEMGCIFDPSKYGKCWWEQGYGIWEGKKAVGVGKNRL